MLHIDNLWTRLHPYITLRYNLDKAEDRHRMKKRKLRKREKERELGVGTGRLKRETGRKREMNMDIC